MKVVGDFNNISKEIKPKKPKNGTIVEYQFLIGRPDYNNPNKTLYPPSYRVKTFDRILDPGKNEYMDIGVFERKVKDKDGNETIRTRAFYLRGAKGLLALTIGGNQDDEMYEFLELSNENQSNPNRDTSVVPMFRRIDAIKDASDRTQKRDVLTSALVYVSNMGEMEIREFAAAMAWGENDDLELLHDQVGEFARTKPNEFVKFFNDPQLRTKALIKNAITKGIIKHDVATNKILWGNGDAVIAALDRQDGKTYVDTFSEWIRVMKGGDNILAGIKKQINASIKENTNNRKTANEEIVAEPE